MTGVQADPGSGDCAGLIGAGVLVRSGEARGLRQGEREMIDYGTARSARVTCFAQRPGACSASPQRTCAKLYRCPSPSPRRYSILGCNSLRSESTADSLTVGTLRKSAGSSTAANFLGLFLS